MSGRCLHFMGFEPKLRCHDNQKKKKKKKWRDDFFLFSNLKAGSLRYARLDIISEAARYGMMHDQISSVKLSDTICTTGYHPDIISEAARYDMHDRISSVKLRATVCTTGYHQ